MPQTKFVLKKSLESRLKPILVLNKIEIKPCFDVKMAQDAVYEPFFELGATEEQLDFRLFTLLEEIVQLN
ncbi:MAG: hypothetical protein R3B55_01645 [Candidatus Paceibacterota bacterium]